jgi:hypothetical protein
LQTPIKEAQMYGKKALIAAASICALGAGAGAMEASGSDSPATTTLQLQAKETGGMPINVGPKGPSVGDQFLGHGVLADAAGHSAGRFQMVTQLVSGNGRHGAEQGSFTLYLADGEIAVTGGHATTSRFTLPVVGGTGRYAGARGTLAVAPGKGETARLTVTLLG